MDDLYDIPEENQYFDGYNVTIFLIDASAPMFYSVPTSDEDVVADCPFTLALKCAHETLMKKIFTFPYDSVAIVLFGTTKSVPNDKYGDYANTCLLQDLKNPDRENILELEKLFREGGTDELKSKACDPQTFSLADSLWMCSSIISKHKSKKDSKQLFLFTNSEEPHSKFSNVHKHAERRFGDLQDDGVSVYLFPIGEDFDASKVYQELFVNGDARILPCSSTTDELLSKITPKAQKKRPLTTLIFNLNPEIKFGVKLYNLISSQTMMPKHIQLDKRTNEPVKTVTTKFNAETAETLLPSELTKYTTVAGEKIRLDKNDMSMLKAKFLPGITLIGFKPISKLKLHLCLRSAHFIYPDDEQVKGSKLIFAALIDRCKNRNVAPICSMKSTMATKPLIVALLPHNDEDENEQGLCFGFHVIYLPFLNDVRKFVYEDLVVSTDVPASDGRQTVPQVLRADQRQIEAAKAIVKKLAMRNPYTPLLFENPALHTKWKLIEGIALEREEVETIVDTTLPDEESIDTRLGARSSAFKDLVFPFHYESETPVSKKKEIGTDSYALVENAARSGNLEKLTVDVLKSYLSGQGVRGFSSKKKADCIERIKSHLNLK